MNMVSRVINQILRYVPIVLVCCLFFTPFVFSRVLFNGVISAKDFWFCGIVLIILIYSCFYVLIKQKKDRIKLNKTDFFLVIFFIWCATNAYDRVHHRLTYNHSLQILIGMSVVYFFIKSILIRSESNSNFSNNVKSTVVNIFTLTLILSGFFQALFGLLQLYNIIPSFNSLYKITGSFPNPAPFAIYLSVVFPVALGRILFCERNSKDSNLLKLNFKRRKLKLSKYIQNELISSIIYYLSITTVILILIVLPATLNRASWLAVIISSSIVLEHRYFYLRKLKFVFHTLLLRVVFAGVAIFIIILLLFAVFNLKRNSTNSRLFIWEVTLDKILEKPFFGQGLGRFEPEYNNWQAQYFIDHPEKLSSPKAYLAGNTKYAFNEYLQMASEIGLIGVFIFIAFVISAFIALKRLIRSIQTTDIKLMLMLIPSLISILVCTFFSFPFYSLPINLIFFMLLGIISGHIEGPYIGFTPLKHINLVFFIFLLIIAYLHISTLKKISEYKTWNIAVQTYNSGAFSEANLIYKRISPGLSNEPLFLQTYGKSLLKDGKNLEAINKLEESKYFNSDDVLYNSLGDAYKNIWNCDKAENNYLFSSYMMPNRLYPKYLLALLYIQCGDTLQAVQKAKETLEMNAKVKSIAEDDIKRQMIKLINNLNK